MGKLSKSNQLLNFTDIADMFSIRENSLKLYFSSYNPEYFILSLDIQMMRF